MSRRKTWPVHQAIAVSFDAFCKRFGADLLWHAFERLTRNQAATLTQHEQWAENIDKYLTWALNYSGAEHEKWLAVARADYGQSQLLSLLGVRWWLARDQMMQLAPKTKILCEHEHPFHDKLSLSLLARMLYHGHHHLIVDANE